MTAGQDRSRAEAETCSSVASAVNKRAKREAWLRRGPLPALKALKVESAST